jgi:hypothetical protein
VGSILSALSFRSILSWMSSNAALASGAGNPARSVLGRVRRRA